MSGDCNDTNILQYPFSIRYKDSDNDGVSDGTMLQQCGQPIGYKLANQLTALSGDCDDNNSSAYSGAVEICNTIDENCNGNAYDVAQIPVSECQALVSLYTGTNGSGWTNSSGWLSGSNIANWYGLTVTGGHVTGLNIPYNWNMSGTIPANFSNLQHLDYLKIALNQNLYGNLSVFSTMTSLKRLDIFETEIS